MKLVIPVVLFALTAALVAVGTLVPSQLGATIGVASGAAVPGFHSAAATPEDAISDLLSSVRKRNWDAAYSSLADAGKLDKQLFVRDLSGSNGSLRTFSGLESWDLQPLHQTSDQAQVRTTLRWTTPVGSVSDVRDLQVVRVGDVWKVMWPVPKFPDVPAQVIPVNYLRWDLVSSTAPDEWGERNVDAPHVRIVSMNAGEYNGGSVVMGEVVNEDTVPAFVNVNATLVGTDGKALDQESSFDNILHVLLPKQVTPYRIDFPTVALQNVKSVHMGIRANLVSAAADPVIGVENQKIVTDAQGRSVLQGELLDLGGRVVNIPHAIATFYDNSGKVIWVSDGYVERALFPQSPEPFAVAIPNSIAGKVHSYHVVVNQYSLGES
jgi:hypothetical protein